MLISSNLFSSAETTHYLFITLCLLLLLLPSLLLLLLELFLQQLLLLLLVGCRPGLFYSSMLRKKTIRNQKHCMFKTIFFL
jgi:hypothetical protein